jgi:hypothetical protein
MWLSRRFCHDENPNILLLKLKGRFRGSVSAFYSDAAPDPTFHSDADPDPTFQFDADPDPIPHPDLDPPMLPPFRSDADSDHAFHFAIRIRLSYLMRIRIKLPKMM